MALKGRSLTLKILSCKSRPRLSGQGDESAQKNSRLHQGAGGCFFKKLGLLPAVIKSALPDGLCRRKRRCKSKAAKGRLFQPKERFVRCKAHFQYGFIKIEGIRMEGNAAAGAQQ